MLTAAVRPARPPPRPPPGILLWEAVTTQRPYASLSAGAIADSVRAGLRPRFPQGTPRALEKLAAACWAADPAARPAFPEVLRGLEGLLAAAEAAAAALP
jgi:hypothetical protein